MPFANFIGSHQRLWTREKVIEGLRLFALYHPGQLPSSDHAYNRLKKDHLQYPPSHRILEYFGTLSRAWIAAGIDRTRVSLNYSGWNHEEILYLKENAGNMLIKDMAKVLRRSYGATRRKLYDLRITSRGNQGYFSAALLAKEFNCSYTRVCKLLKQGDIPGRLCLKRHRWLVDINDINPEIRAALRDVRKTHKNEPLDRGDYYERYGIRRTMINGRLTRIENFTE